MTLVAKLSLEAFFVREELAYALNNELYEQKQNAVGKVCQLDLSLDEMLANLEERSQRSVDATVAALGRLENATVGEPDDELASNLHLGVNRRDSECDAGQTNLCARHVLVESAASFGDKFPNVELQRLDGVVHHEKLATPNMY